METETKISKLKNALISGQVITPAGAFRRWGMQANTFHRSIWSLKQQGIKIKSITRTGSNGNRFSQHAIEI